MRISDWSSDVCSSDLLDLAKVEAGKLDLRHDAVRVDALFETCSRLMDERAAGAGVSLVIEPTQVPVLFADDTRLRRSDERRVGKECVSTCGSRWTPRRYKKNT